MKGPSRAIREQAAQIIEQRGWCQQAYEDQHGRVCIAGAIRLVVNGSPVTITSKSQAVLREVRREIGAETLTAWNDYPLRTQAQVLAALRGTTE